MKEEDRLIFLKLALNVFGTIFIIGVPLMMWLWSSGWAWTPRQPEYEQMILGIYGTLGFFLIHAAKNPVANLSLIWFTIASSIVHSTIMLVHAISDDTESAHLLADIPALLVVAFVLWYLLPKNTVTNR